MADDPIVTWVNNSSRGDVFATVDLLQSVLSKRLEVFQKIATIAFDTTTFDSNPVPVLKRIKIVMDSEINCIYIAKQVNHPQGSAITLAFQEELMKYRTHLIDFRDSLHKLNTLHKFEIALDSFEQRAFNVLKAWVEEMKRQSRPAA